MGFHEAAEGLYLDPWRVPVELLRYSLDLLKSFFNIQRASRSLAKTGLCFHFFGDFFGALFQVVFAASLWGVFGVLWEPSGQSFDASGCHLE